MQDMIRQQTIGGNMDKISKFIDDCYTAFVYGVVVLGTIATVVMLIK